MARRSNEVHVLDVARTPDVARRIHAALGGCPGPRFEVRHAEDLEDAIDRLPWDPVDAALLEIDPAGDPAPEILVRFRAASPGSAIVGIATASCGARLVQAPEDLDDLVSREQISHSGLLVRAVLLAIERCRLRAMAAHARRMEEIGRLAGEVAHSYSNLLTSLASSFALLEGKVVSAEDREQLASLQRSARQAMRLTRQLIEVAPRTGSTRREARSAMPVRERR